MKTFHSFGATGKKLILRGALLFSLGVLTVIFRDKVPYILVNLFLSYMQLLTLWDIFSRLFRKTQTNENLFILIIKFSAITILLSYNIASTTSVFIIGLGVASYQIFIGIINLITYILYKKDNIKPRLRLLLDGTLLTIIGLIGILFLPSRTDELMWYLGLFLCFYGVTTFRDGLFFENEIGKNNLKRKTRVSLPLFIAALVPISTLRSLNKFLLENSEESLENVYNTSKSDNESVNFEVFIHVGETGLKTMGHVDICYKGTVLSFGQYDEKSNKFFGSIGDGVFFKVEKNKYIDFCKKEDNKTIMSYGLKLSSKQLIAVEERISEIENITIPWQPSDEKIIFNKEKNIKEPMYAYKLVKETNAETFKFTKSKFKTYFVLSTNCVLLADSIIGKSGTDILNPKGFISPGTYQDYLNKEYNRPNSIVISKKIYS